MSNDVGVLAILPRRDHICQIFDGTCAQQDMPVRFARRLRERSRHAEQRRAARRQQSVQFGKPQVVTNRQTERPTGVSSNIGSSPGYMELDSR